MKRQPTTCGSSPWQQVESPLGWRGVAPVWPTWFMWVMKFSTAWFSPLWSTSDLLLPSEASADAQEAKNQCLRFGGMSLSIGLLLRPSRAGHEQQSSHPGESSARPASERARRSPWCAVPADATAMVSTCTVPAAPPTPRAFPPPAAETTDAFPAAARPPRAGDRTSACLQRLAFCHSRDVRIAQSRPAGTPRPASREQSASSREPAPASPPPRGTAPRRPPRRWRNAPAQMPRPPRRARARAVPATGRRRGFRSALPQCQSSAKPQRACNLHARRHRLQ